ncbi:pyridoxal phosphate-dependent transferase [Kalaharituber pfeilii]|nr:pyridoxal phosphate-dependent transferase [Kalaharituber pfeilii]
MFPKMDISTLAIHADDALAATADVAPPIHVSTTYRYPGGHGHKYREVSPDEYVTAKDQTGEPGYYVYSRHASPTSTRLEQTLSVILSPAVAAPSPDDRLQPLHPTVTYSSGQSAFHAALVHFRPKTLSIGTCYHGCRRCAELFSSLTGMRILPLDCPAEELSPGDLIHVETPMNPYGTAVSIAALAEKAHSRGAFLMVDSTFAPPPLQDPFAFGADVVMHSSTKYIGGHSDLLGGVLVIRHDYDGIPHNGARIACKLMHERVLLGGVMGSLEGWLGLRSTRTLGLRVTRASASAANLVKWLHSLTSSDPNCPIEKVHHASIQHLDDSSVTEWLSNQMPNGYGPVFAITMRNPWMARHLPSKLTLFHHATSLGGVESLIEWRAMSDARADERLLRVSVGCEDWSDLKADLERGLKEVQGFQEEKS